MTKLLLALVAFVILAAIAVVIKNLTEKGRQANAGEDAPPFKKTDSLLTKAERSFYGILNQAVGSDMLIFVKVRMEDLFYLPKGTPNRQSWRNKVSQKHVDFVLCDRANISPVIVIELDDSSHDEEDRQKSDGDKDRFCAAAGLSILRFSAKRGYVVQEIVDAVKKQLPVTVK